MASNELQGNCLMDGVWDSAAKGTLFGIAGAGSGYAFNGAIAAASRAAFSRLPLATQLFLTSNAIGGPYLSRSAASWTMGGTVTGNAISTFISNLNQ